MFDIESEREREREESMSAAASLMAMDEELTETYRRYQDASGERGGRRLLVGDSAADFEAVFRERMEEAFDEEDEMVVDDACEDLLAAAAATTAGPLGDARDGVRQPFGVSTENLGMFVFTTLQNMDRSRQAAADSSRPRARPSLAETRRPTASGSPASGGGSKRDHRGRLVRSRADLSPESFARPVPLEPTSFLEPGMSFEGSQNVSPSSPSESWDLKVTIEEADFKRGYVCGTMHATGFNCGDSAQGGSPVATFWEGEIVDNVNHSFYTQKWGANKSIDRKHWSRLAPFTRRLRELVPGGGQLEQEPVDLASQPYVYLRLKEKYFLNEEPGGNLTIAGFYYLCVSRSTGEISGYYFDPNSTPYQRVSLQVTYEGSGGYTTAGGDLV